MRASVVNKGQLSLLALLLAMISGCGTGTPRDPAEIEQVVLFEKDAADVAIPSGFGSSRVKNWRVVDDSTMVIDTVGHGELVATFMTPCRGIRYAEALGFATMGPFEIDRTTRVILPDGRRCHFKELKPLIKLDEPNSEDASPKKPKPKELNPKKLNPKEPDDEAQ